MLNHLSPEHVALLTQFERHLVDTGYSHYAIHRECAVAANFLRYLELREVDVADVQPLHVEKYLRNERRRFHRRHGRVPLSIGHWRASHTAGIHQLLRMGKRRWPLEPAPGNTFEEFVHGVFDEFARWLQERGLAAETMDDLLAEARRFMSWYRVQPAAGDDLRSLRSADIDAYQQARSPSLRRISRKALAQRLRCFLRFLHASGRTPGELASRVLAPTLYALESIPSALSQQQIDAVVGAQAGPAGGAGHPSLPAKNLAELVAYVKASPGKVSYASYSPGTLSHVMGLQLNKAAGIDMTHVGYKGSTPGLADVMGGHVQLMFDGIPTSMPMIKAGKVVPFAVSLPQRSPLLPNVPTFAELGYPEIQGLVWQGLWVTPDVPASAQNRLRDATLKVLAQPAIRERLKEISLEVSQPRTSEEMTKTLRADYERIGEVLKSINFKPE